LLVPEVMRPHQTLDDRALVELLASGNPDAFNEIYQRHWYRMFIWARKILPDASDAEDAVQEILTYIWNKRLEISLRESLSSYLYKSVRNQCLMLINRNKLQQRYWAYLQDFMDPRAPVTDEQVRERELQAIIDWAISSLPSKMREVFVISRYEQLSHKEIAQALNLSETTVKKK